LEEPGLHAGFATRRARRRRAGTAR
jgi:hypothetical protein